MFEASTKTLTIGRGESSTLTFRMKDGARPSASEFVLFVDGVEAATLVAQEDPGVPGKFFFAFDSDYADLLGKKARMFRITRIQNGKSRRFLIGQIAADGFDA